MKIFGSVLVLTVFFISACVSEKENSNEPVESENQAIESTRTVASEYPYDPSFEQLARFISGVSGSDSSKYKKLEETQIWKNYQLQLASIWKKTNEKIPVMKEWASKEMLEVNKTGGTLLYPFSGPDFLHADIFFPAFDTIIMFGLEPIGNVPDLLSMEVDTVGVYLNDVRQSLNAILGLSFFRTVAMADDFRSSLDGVLPLFLQFFNQTGHELLYLEKIVILPDGTYSKDISQKTDSSYVGNCYYFKKIGSDKVRVLQYFAVNLQNTPYYSRVGLSAKGLETRTDLVNFIKNSNFNATYLKSASYLMHRPSFSIIKDLILNDSDYLLQDDSGIPVADFDRNEWDLTFYGSYVKPISMFSDRAQEDLKRIYEGDSITIEVLPFGIGYQHRNGTSNLMKAKRK